MALLNSNWRIASGFTKFHVLKTYIELNKKYNFIHGKLDYVYDSFPNLIWNSGRVSAGQTIDYSHIRSIINYYNDNDIGFSLVATNNQLQSKHLRDKYGNEILHRLNNPRNAVIISSEIMFKYIKKYYPKLRTIHSCIPNCDDVKYLQDMQQQYDMVVIPPKANRRFKILHKLDPNKIELLVNEYCLMDCAIREKHYDSLSQTALLHGVQNDYKEKNCPRRALPLEEVMARSCLLSFEEVQDLHDMGYVNFKLQGRAAPDPFFVYDLIKYTCDPKLNSHIFRETLAGSDMSMQQLQQFHNNQQMENTRLNIITGKPRVNPNPNSRSFINPVNPMGKNFANLTIRKK